MSEYLITEKPIINLKKSKIIFVLQNMNPFPMNPNPITEPYSTVNQTAGEEEKKQKAVLSNTDKI